MLAGVAISPDTPSTAISDDVGKAADMLLVMTVYPGNVHMAYNGQDSQMFSRPRRAEVH
jgi:pentose-5-phosphate-3-epimerase